MLRDAEVGHAPQDGAYTVGDAVRDWLAYGLSAGESTVTTNRGLADTHIVPLLGARRLRDLTAEEVDRWLAGRAQH